MVKLFLISVFQLLGSMHPTADPIFWVCESVLIQVDNMILAQASGVDFGITLLLQIWNLFYMQIHIH
jgi:hypothetical protein